MRRRILVVDDDWELRSFFQALLESEGYEVDTASDGQIAWEKLDQQPGTYEAILLEVEMPPLDWLRLLRALRQPEEVWAQPLILMSANSEALQHAVGMGMSSVLEKPCDLEVVLARISACLF